MPPESADPVAELLQRYRDGDPAAADEVLRLVYDELHQLARRQMAQQQPWHTLQATALLNEAVLRMFRDDGAALRDREHLLALAARAMRSVLIDHARKRSRQKRGGAATPLALDMVVEQYQERAHDLVALDEALSDLAEVDGELAHLVELHFFGRLSLREIARVWARPRHIVERDWQLARAWLRTRLQ